MISLLEHLARKYLEKVKETTERTGDPGAVPMEGLSCFLKFAQDYLNKQRPSAINHKCELNFRVTLQDGQEVLIAPELYQPVKTGLEEPDPNETPFRSLRGGDMAPGGASVAISGREDSGPSYRMDQGSQRL